MYALDATPFVLKSFDKSVHSLHILQLFIDLQLFAKSDHLPADLRLIFFVDKLVYLDNDY